MSGQWDEIFKKQGRVFLKPQKDLPTIAKLFKKEKVKRVLDLGCGSGRHLVYLARQGFEVWGLDCATHGLKLAKDWLKQENLKAFLQTGDIYQKLPYQDCFFEAVISISTLHHNKIEKIRKLIKELQRVLKPGGWLFVTLRRSSIRKWLKGRVVVYRCFGNQNQKKIRYKIIGERTYLPLEGGEKGLIHFCFNQKLIKKEFKEFKILKIWTRDNEYCFLAKRK